MREIAVQASNDTNNAQDRANLQAEMSAMGVEIDRIAGTTTWAGANLMDTDRSFTFQVGAATGGQNQIGITITNMSMQGLNIGSAANSAAFTINDATASQFISSEKTANTDDVTVNGTDEMTVAQTGTLTIIHPNTGVASVATITKDDAAATAQSIRANLGHLGVGAEVAGANNANKIQLTFSPVAATTNGTTNIDVTSRANALSIFPIPVSALAREVTSILVVPFVVAATGEKVNWILLALFAPATSAPTPRWPKFARID
jgi:flagellin